MTSSATSGGAQANRSRPVQTSPAPHPPLIAPTGNAGVNSVIDVINSTAAPFMNAPPPEQGAAGQVAQGLGGVLGVIGAPQMIIDTAFASLTAPIAAMFPSLPAMTLGAMHVGWPHAHLHPPSFIPPAPPIPLPSIGVTLGSGSISVLLAGMPAARAGDIGLAITCGSLAPPFEIFTGSSNVFIGGARAARILDITQHCNPMSMGPFAIAMGAAGVVAGAAGAIATGNAYAAAQAAADAAVLAVKLLCGKDPGIPPGWGALVGPPVPNVLIGGFPCPPVGDMAMGGLMKLLGKVTRALRSRNSRRGNAHCADGGEPIYLPTGENFSTFVDFVSGGLFEWRRHVTSARAKLRGSLGRGFRHFLQRSLSVRLHRTVFTDWDGEQIHFPRFERGSDTTRGDGHVLRRLGSGRYRVSYRGQPAMEFAGGEFEGELPLVKLTGEESELELFYDRTGQLAACIETRLVAPEGRRRWEFSRDADGHILEIAEVGAADTDRRSAAQRLVRAAYQYDEQGRLLKSLDALGGIWAYEYDAFHRITKQTDPRGYFYTYKYDVWGRCVQTSGMDGLWRCSIQYYPEKKFTRYTEGENATWEHHYDSDGFVTKIVDPYGGEKIRERDPEGRIVREIDAGGRQLQWLYDADDAHFARKDRFGYLYLPELEEPRMHDPFARKLPSTALTRMFADGVRADERARVGASRFLLTFAPPELSERVQRTFRFQRADAVRAPATAHVERDALGRKVRETDARGRIREWRYDATGNVIAIRDHDERWVQQATTSWNLLGARCDALGNAMRFRYSSIEQTVGIVDPLGNASAYDYNLRGRLTGVHRNGRLREQYIYDEGDHFVEKRDGRGEILFSNTVHANHFVAMRRLASGGFHRFDYDERGRITEASTDRCEVRRAFDAAGRPTDDERDGLGVRHRYAPGHRLTAVLGRFELLEDARKRGQITLSGPAGAKTVLREIEPGILLRESSSGTMELLQFDEDERLEARLVWKRTSDGAWNTWSVRYSYTSEGDLVRIEDSARGVTQYEVDAAHRLIAETTPYGQRHTYRLDAAGNVLAKLGLKRVEVGPGNRLSASEDERFEYDHRDHLSRRLGRDGSSTTYTYDSFDMLARIERKSVIDSAVFEYEYDGLGRRTVARTPGHQRTFYWDGDRLAAEILPDGRLRIYSYPTRSALVPITFTEYADAGAEPESGTSYFVHSDPVGMPLHIEDASGRIVWWATRIDPYGLVEIHPISEIEYNLRWPGHYFDPETGLHYNRYRYYDPTLGRYLQSDPLGYAGSEVNLYAYPANPLVQVDVLGLAHPGKPKQNDDSSSDNDGQDRPPRTDTDGENQPAGPKPVVDKNIGKNLHPDEAARIMQEETRAYVEDQIRIRDEIKRENADLESLRRQQQEAARNRKNSEAEKRKAGKAATDNDTPENRNALSAASAKLEADRKAQTEITDKIAEIKVAQQSRTGERGNNPIRVYEPAYDPVTGRMVVVRSGDEPAGGGIKPPSQSLDTTEPGKCGMPRAVGVLVDGRPGSSPSEMQTTAGGFSYNKDGNLQHVTACDNCNDIVDNHGIQVVGDNPEGVAPSTPPNTRTNLP
ncbi:RHS repeat-associated core domain-containing protein [Polyangium aurulentum]|uniref:RHS repeat-associated core domain-containing protein n=1 Tax=Polyangium aurulentum TaxID=2567896 RepID=UPI0010AEBE93|nr:RHS repeat-associated core domain-containing protein [Polyangium aurulentum]UQA57126.1 PAAR domain-containing protein [Polyangium aurulentum]